MVDATVGVDSVASLPVRLVSLSRMSCPFAGTEHRCDDWHVLWFHQLLRNAIALKDPSRRNQQNVGSFWSQDFWPLFRASGHRITTLARLSPVQPERGSILLLARALGDADTDGRHCYEPATL